MLNTQAMVLDSRNILDGTGKSIQGDPVRPVTDGMNRDLEPVVQSSTGELIDSLLRRSHQPSHAGSIAVWLQKCGPPGAKGPVYKYLDTTDGQH